VEPDEVLGRSVFSRRTWIHAVMGVLYPGYVRNAQKLDAGPKHYDRYGFRVPAVLVSPYARPGYVTSQTFDHTSVLKLIEQKWNLPPLTARDAAADSPLDALDLTSPPAFAEPPELPEPALRWGSWPAEV
jgi:phospholipase C